MGVAQCNRAQIDSNAAHFSAHLLRFRFRLLDQPASAQHAPNHPERADPKRACPVNERQAMVRIVGDFQEFLSLLIFGVSVHDRNVDIT